MTDDLPVEDDELLISPFDNADYFSESFQLPKEVMSVRKTIKAAEVNE